MLKNFVSYKISNIQSLKNSCLNINEDTMLQILVRRLLLRPTDGIPADILYV